MARSGLNLSEEQRRTAFVAVAAVVLCLVVLMGALRADPSHPRRATASPRHRGAGARVIDTTGSDPRIVDSSSLTATTTTARVPGVRGTTPGTPGVTAPAGSQAIVTDASQFLAAYLAYETGTFDASTRAALSRSAAPAIADQLIAHPVELPAGEHPPSGRVRSLVVSGQPTSPSVSVRATIERGGWSSGLTLHLDRAGGVWLVMSLG